LEKLHQQEFLLDEYKRAMDEEIKKGNQYKALLAQKQQSLAVMIGGNKQLEQMQKLVN
jgi:hypothetical protein